jgi:hypothetical protein
VRKILVETRSFVLFYILSFIMFFFMLALKTKSIQVLVLLPMFYCVLFSLRLYVRGKKLKRLDYFNIHEKGYKTDAKKRGDQLGDIVAIIVYIFLALSVDKDFFKDFGNSTIGISLFCCVFYFAAASASIARNSKFLKVITILLSTIQGLLFLLIGTSIILIFISSVLQGRGIQPAESFLTTFEGEFIVSLCYFSEAFLKETILVMISSIFLFIVFIFSTPPYQLEELAMAFKIVNILIIILSIMVYIFANMSWVSIQEFIKGVSSNDSIHVLQYMELDPDFRDYMQMFTKSSIINMGYILFLPYTLGAVISNLTIEFLKKNYSKKAMYALDRIIDLKSNGLVEQEEICRNERQYFFWGGDKHLLKIHDAIYKAQNSEESVG